MAPKLLFISPCTPDPCGTGWEQRAFSFLAVYARYCDVHLWFQPTADNPSPARGSKLAPYCKSITPTDLRQIAKRLTKDGGSSHDIVVTYDCVHVFTSANIVNVIDHPCIFWDIDHISPRLNPRGFGDVSPGSKEEVLSTFVSYTHAWRRCRIVFASSPLENLGGLPMIVAPNALSIVPKDVPEPSQSKTLLFVGGLDYYPNVEGLAFFCEEILPLLPGDIKLRVVGRSPKSAVYVSRLASFASNGRVEFYYDVKDCAPHYAHAAACIAPINLGAGTRIKILEAFAFRRALVSTEKGCEGLAVTNEEQLLIADSPKYFAAACERLLGDPDLAQRLAHAAFDFFNANHSLDKLSQIIHEALVKAGLLHN